MKKRKIISFGILMLLVSSLIVFGKYSPIHQPTQTIKPLTPSEVDTCQQSLIYVMQYLNNSNLPHKEVLECITALSKTYNIINSKINIDSTDKKK